MHTALVVFYQTVTLIILVLIYSFFYKGKDFHQLNRSVVNKVLITLPVGISIFMMYRLDISNVLAIYIIILTLTVMYAGLGDALFIYFFILLGIIYLNGNIILKQELLITYFVMIMLSYLGMLIIKSYQKRMIAVFILSFIFLNIELIINKLTTQDFIIYNVSGLIIWGLVIYITLYHYQKNRSYLEYQESAFMDKTTNIRNYFCLLNRSYRLLKDKKANISLILINVDRLKDINKLYGNNCGDQVIKIVAESIKENVEEYGEVYRLDGDTFCVIAINEKFKMMQTISERIRLDIDLKNLIIDNNKINLSVSVGGYFGKIESRNIDDYIEVAHDSLLNSKYNGRNRVIINNQMVYFPNIL